MKSLPWEFLVSGFKKGVFSIVDQGFNSFAILVVHILLARWFVSSAYGAFAVAYSIYVLMQAIYLGLFFEPVLILSNKEFREGINIYYNRVLLIHLIVSVLFFLVFISVSLFVKNSFLSESFIGMSIGVPLLLFYNMVRRFLYVKYSSDKSALCGVFFFAIVFVLLMSINYFKIYSIGLIFIILGLSALFSGIMGMYFLRFSNKMNLPNQVVMKDITLAKVFSSHIKYGKWAGLGYTLNWVAGNIQFILLPVLLGMELTAAFRALVNFITPVQQVIVSLNLLFLPFISNKVAIQSEYRRFVVLYTALIIFLTIVFWVFLNIYGQNLISLLYNGRYVEFSSMFKIAGAVPLFGCVFLPVSYTLRAMGLINKVFNSFLISSVSSVVSMLLLVKFLGLSGAFIASILTSCASGVYVYIVYYKLNFKCLR